uniref:Ycf36 n=1 Tax=Alsidium seaforthii TaxID=2007182 RepID=A0A1Z1MDL5_9FLOR|nr:hypothetical protein [Bryothamnion seaforthii]ARW63962.1 hypothetical protein [Bryothamnion seaforthii]
MCTIKNNCPVPFDQQPLNEYLSLKKSILFSWSLSQIRPFVFGLLLIFLFIYFVLSLLIIPLMSRSNIFKVFSLDFFISNIFLFVIFIRLYLGWSYIMKRLLSATVFYEESGWYDGQVWVKTSKYLIQDRLIGLYQIKPFIQRIKYTFILITINLFLSYLLYSIF